MPPVRVHDLSTFPHNFSTGFNHVVLTDPVSGCSVSMRHRSGKPSADQAGPASCTEPGLPCLVVAPRPGHLLVVERRPTQKSEARVSIRLAGERPRVVRVRGSETFWILT
jgi:hypothetical protein